MKAFRALCLILIRSLTAKAREARYPSLICRRSRRPISFGLFMIVCSALVALSINSCA